MNALTEVKSYPLPDALADKLVEIDSVAQSMARVGKPVPEAVALDGRDFDTIDTIVRLASGERYSATSVTLSGRPLSRVAA